MSGYLSAQLTGTVDSSQAGWVAWWWLNSWCWLDVWLSGWLAGWLAVRVVGSQTGCLVSWWSSETLTETDGLEQRLGRQKQKHEKEKVGWEKKIFH